MAKKKEIQVGSRVEIRSHPFKGRTGIVRGRGRIGGFAPCWEVWCDDPDMFGRRLVRCRPRDLTILGPPEE